MTKRFETKHSKHWLESVSNTDATGGVGYWCETCKLNRVWLEGYPRCDECLVKFSYSAITLTGTTNKVVADQYYSNYEKTLKEPTSQSDSLVKRSLNWDTLTVAKVILEIPALDHDFFVVEKVEEIERYLQAPSERTITVVGPCFQLTKVNKLAIITVRCFVKEYLNRAVSAQFFALFTKNVVGTAESYFYEEKSFGVTNSYPHLLAMCEVDWDTVNTKRCVLGEKTWYITNITHYYGTVSIRSADTTLPDGVKEYYVVRHFMQQCMFGFTRLSIECPLVFGFPPRNSIYDANIENASSKLNSVIKSRVLGETKFI